MDRSMRTYDKNGHLIVEKTVISKACVNPYMGREIVDHKNKGLDPDKVYNLLRDPEELFQALSSFEGIQLLIKHTPVDSEEPRKDLTVGSVSGVEMDGDKVYASLRVFDKEAIGLIESGKLDELSAGYMYLADMTAGEYEGQPYDGVMRNIHANHVALVEKGRIGRDALIADSLPTEITEVSMKLKKGSMKLIADAIKQCAMDEEMKSEKVEEVIKAVQDGMIEDEEDEKAAKDSDKKAEDEDKEAKDEDDKKKACDYEEDKAKDEDKKEDEKPAMDAASIEAAAVQRVTALFEAKEIVKPLVGEVNGVGMDSAEKVFEYALKTKGVDVSGVHPSAYGAMVKMIPTDKKVVALDSAFAGKPEPLTARFKK